MGLGLAETSCNVRKTPEVEGKWPNLDIAVSKILTGEGTLRSERSSGGLDKVTRSNLRSRDPMLCVQCTLRCILTARLSDCWSLNYALCITYTIPEEPINQVIFLFFIVASANSASISSGSSFLFSFPTFVGAVRLPV